MKFSLFLIPVLFSQMSFAVSYLNVEGPKAHEMYLAADEAGILGTEENVVLGNRSMKIHKMGPIRCEAIQTEEDYRYACSVNGSSVSDERLSHNLYHSLVGLTGDQFETDTGWWTQAIELSCTEETTAEEVSYRCMFQD